MSRSPLIFVVILSTLFVALPAAAQEEAPSNAELYRMLKEQQEMLAKQAAVIEDLRAELLKSNEALKETQSNTKQGDRQAPELTAQVEKKEKNKDSSTRVDGNTGHDDIVAVAKPNSVSMEASYLYVLPTLSDTYYASIGGTASPNGTLYANDPDYDSAFRIGAAYTSGHSGRKLNASFTYLDSSSSDQLSGSQLWAARGSADLLSNFENYTGTATSSIDLKYRNVDVLMSEPVNWGGVESNFLYGIEYAHMSWDETETYSRTGVTSISRSTAKFNGVGPQIGFNLSYKPFAGLNSLVSGFAIETMASGSLLLATSSSSLADTQNGTNIGAVQTDDTERVIPTLHGRIGLSYNYDSGPYHTTFGGGYESSIYINGLQRLGNHDDVADGQYTVLYDNFDLSGLDLWLKFNMEL